MFDSGAQDKPGAPSQGRFPAGAASRGNPSPGVSADSSTVSPLADATAVEAALQLAESAQPGIGTLATLVRIDPRTLGSQDAVRLLQGLERHLGWLHSIQAVALVSAAGEQPQTADVQIGDPERGDEDPGIMDISREEIACATGWGSGYAQHRIDVARILCGFLPEVMQALSRGAIGYAHAAAIADAAEQLPGFSEPDQRDAFAQACHLLQERVMKTALTSSVTRTRRAAARAALQIADMDHRGRKRRSALAHSVTLLDDPDGSSTLIARMPAHHAHACMAAIQHLANHPMLDLPCDASIGQRRALALATLVIGPRPPHPGVGEVPPPQAGSTGVNPTDQPNPIWVELPQWPQGMPIAPQPKVHLDLVFTLDALLGLSDQHAAIPGAGLIPADIAQGLLADATMRRMVTDPMTGHLLDLGRRTYRIPEALRQFIHARDQTCRFPGCNRRAVHCEVDHAVPWSQGGQTGPGNLGALCTRHHRMKTHAGWTIQDTHPSGSCVWTSPHGRTYAHHPPPPLATLTRTTSRESPGPDEPPPESTESTESTESIDSTGPTSPVSSRHTQLTTQPPDLDAYPF